MPTEDEAVHLLEELGLTEYESRCYVALTRVGNATAKEVSDLSYVPRSRVYDAVDRLHERGLVDVQQSDPRAYQSVPVEVALESLREEYASKVDAAGEALDKLERAETQEHTGAWAIADHDHVSDRIGTLADDAATEVYLLVVDGDVVEGRLVEQVTDAASRGASVVVEAPSGAVAERFTSAGDATVRQTTLAAADSSVEGKWLGRVLMVDRKSVLISSVTGSVRPGRSQETAIWATGANHGLVVGFRHLLGARIDEPGGLREME
jgi:sugar-specific transcriptional regulator TrmB